MCTATPSLASLISLRTFLDLSWRAATRVGPTRGSIALLLKHWRTFSLQLRACPPTGVTHDRSVAYNVRIFLLIPDAHKVRFALCHRACVRAVSASSLFPRRLHQKVSICRTELRWNTRSSFWKCSRTIFKCSRHSFLELAPLADPPG